MIREKIQKIRNWFVDTTLTVMSVGMVFFLGLILFWYHHDYKVVTWNIPYYQMQKKEYQVGEPLTFRTAFCKQGNFEASIVYHIEDGVTYLMPEQVSRSDEGCRDFISSSLSTPNIPEGTYRIRGTITYQVNPVKTQTYQLYSNEFRIVSK